MKLIKKSLWYLLLLSYLSGCAASRTTIISGGSGLTDIKVCRNYLNDKDLLKEDYVAKDFKESDYIYALKSQMRYRSLHEQKCQEVVSQDNNKLIKGFAAALVVAAAAVAVSNSGGSGGSNYASGYAWDGFYDDHYNLVWRCRDKSTGKFAYNSHCSGLTKSDHTWTGK